MSDIPSRLAHLKAMVAGAEERMLADGCSDQNFAILGRMRADFLIQIDELGGGEQSKPKETGLSDFQQRLAEREAAAKGSRRTKSN